MLNKKMSLAVRSALGLAAVASAMSAGLALGQDTDVEEIEEVMVTGSRIARPDLEGASPVMVIDRATIVASGVTDIGSLIQRMPSASGSPLGTTTNNGGDGGVYVDLRGLGSIRTLSLVNGRRTVDGGDYQTIPGVMIERADILKDGASAVYGADAVAGVVNIITRSDFEGLEIEFQTSDSVDVPVGQDSISFIAGKTFDGGNFIFGAELIDQEGAFQGDYPWEHFQNAVYIYPDLSCLDGGLLNCYVGGSSRIPEGRIRTSEGDIFMNPDGQGLAAYDGRTFNYAPINYMQTPYKRLNLFAEGKFDINDSTKIYTEFRANQRSSAQELAPQPYNSPTDPSYNGGLSKDNYYWNNAYQAYLGSSEYAALLAEDPANALGADTPEVTDLRRRMLETPRRFEQEITQLQFTAGVTGETGYGDWTYDAFVNTGYRERLDTDYGQFFGTYLTNSMGPSADLDGDGSPECYGDINDPDTLIVGCVPTNFVGGTGTFTAEMLDYVGIVLTDTRHSEQLQWGFNFSGSVMELPAGTLQAAIGYEYRDEQSDFRPDGAKVKRQVTGNKGAGTEGQYDVSSFYGEALIPVFDNGTQNVMLETGFRSDDYSTFGSNTTYMAKINATLMEGLRLRATYSDVFRAPSIGELYAGNSDSFPTYNDPCNEANFANSPGCSQIAPQLDSQVQATVGGNANLLPEQGDSITAGIVYSTEISDITMNVVVDYWKITGQDVIDSLGVGYILDSCYVEQTAAACNLVTRRADYSVGNVLDAALNVAEFTADGVDFQWDMAMDLGNGELVADILWAHQLGNERIAFAGDDVDDLTGRFVGSSYAQDKISYKVGYSMNNWAVTYLGEYISSMDGNINYAAGTQPIDAELYHDLVGSYNIEPLDLRIAVGVTNLTDEAPPYIDYGSINGSTDPSTYRLAGRSYYVRLTKTF